MLRFALLVLVPMGTAGIKSNISNFGAEPGCNGEWIILATGTIRHDLRFHDYMILYD